MLELAGSIPEMVWVVGEAFQEADRSPIVVWEGRLARLAVVSTPQAAGEHGLLCDARDPNVVVGPLFLVMGRECWSRPQAAKVPLRELKACHPMVVDTPVLLVV